MFCVKEYNSEIGFIGATFYYHESHPKALEVAKKINSAGNGNSAFVTELDYDASGHLREMVVYPFEKE